MPPVARQTDNVAGVCYGHGPIPIPVAGQIATGAVAKVSGGNQIARMGDVVTLSCGHVAIISSGSTKLTCLGPKVGRVSDTATGPPIVQIATGNPAFVSV